MGDNKIKAEVCKCDEPNGNGYIYPKEVMEKAIRKFNEGDGIAFFPGPTLRPGLADAAGFAKLSMDGDMVKVEIELIGDDKLIENSKLLADMHKAGRAGFGLRGVCDEKSLSISSIGVFDKVPPVGPSDEEKKDG